MVLAQLRAKAARHKYVLGVISPTNAPHDDLQSVYQSLKLCLLLLRKTNPPKSPHITPYSSSTKMQILLGTSIDH
jgi:hypothetical protein